MVLDEDEQSARVIVADHQLSLAIGKEGQNARLAAKLTEWKIDIKSETQYREMLEAAWMSDFDEAVAADELERGEYLDEDGYSDEESEEELVVTDGQSAAEYLNMLSDTLESLGEEESETEV